MRTLLCLFLLTTPGLGLALAQNGTLGAFTHADDVGAPPRAGSAVFDAGSGEYRITGSGTDIWGRADQFRYVWREMSGDFAVTATAKFLTDGNPHRKAVIMLRKSLDADSPFVHLAIHGDGMPSLQFRSAPGDTTNTVDFPIDGSSSDSGTSAGTWTLKVVRIGTAVTVWISKDGTPLRELGHTLNTIGSPVLVGLGVSSHTQEASSTVLFSNVSVQPLPKLGAFTNAADVGGPAIKGSAAFTAASGEYRITGSGANIWGKQDQFQFVWREMTGDFAATATVRFLGQGNDHRKGGIMVRQSLDNDAPYADVVMHGNGMPGLQWRNREGEETNTFDLPIEGPGTYTIKLVRTGVRIYMFVAREGATLREIAHTEVSLQNPVLVGLVVCSHNAEASDTAIFSDVSIK